MLDAPFYEVVFLQYMKNIQTCDVEIEKKKY